MIKIIKLLLILVPIVLLTGCPVPFRGDVYGKRRYYSNPVTGKNFWMYVPSNFAEMKNKKSWPVIVSCHGTIPYDTSDMHARDWEWFGERYECIIVCPDLDGTDGIFGDGPVSAMIADEKHILSILSIIGYRFNIDKANIMISGFSGGGFPMYWVGLRNPDVFSTVVARNCNFNEPNLDGWYPPEAAKTQSVLVYYGSEDPATIIVQSDNAIAYLRSRGFNLETKVVSGGHERKTEVAMDFFKEHWRPPVPSQIIREPVSGGR